MTTSGSTNKDLFLELRRKRVEEEKKKVNGSSGITITEASTHRGDMMPPPIEKSKSKCKDRSSKSGTPRPSSPKKGCTTFFEGGVDALATLFDSTLKINEGIKVTLSTDEADIVSTIRLEALLYALNEFQARAIIMVSTWRQY